jgi:hypothetical protein
MTTTEIELDDRNQTVSNSFKIFSMDVNEFNRTKGEYHNKAFANYGGVNATAAQWNNGLRGLVTSAVKSHRDKFLKENDFFTALNIKVDENTKSVYTAPTVTKKPIPQPTIGKNKEFASEPTLSKAMYDDILKVIYDSGKGMERKPSLYKGKDEEALRDQFLFVLENRYDSTTVGSETFNRGGKTDIIIKHAQDGSNLFVAECKVWYGASEFQEAISQLFDRYLTWRDSKAALLIFVKNKQFTAVNNTIMEEVKKHPYFVRANGTKGQTSFSYYFRLPQDKDKNVFLEIITFHYDK